MDTSNQYLNCLCRTCMTELVQLSSYDGGTTPQQQWLSILDIIEEECVSWRIAELLSQAVPQIEMQTSDELPKKICSKCLQQLLSVHRFQQMCLQSEEQMRKQISKKQTELGIPAVSKKGEIATNDAGSCPLEHSALQEPLAESKGQVVKLEAAEIDDTDQFQEQCTDRQVNLSEFIKNEPIEDEEPEMEYSDGDTMQSTISVKDEMMTKESEEQQINETNVEKDHIAHGEDKPYECPYCPRRFKSNLNMYHHKAIHEGGIKGEACDICGKTMRKWDLKRHKLTHTGVKQHKCDSCGKCFAHIGDLRNHSRKHTGEKPYKCKYCERCFSRSGAHRKHMSLHLGINIHRCELCPLAFPAVKELREHFATHKNEDAATRERNMKALQEAEAELQLKSAKEIRRNRQNYHQDEDKPYECPHCPLRFKAKSNMYQHKAIHEGIKREDCDICGKSIMKKHLKEHKLTHNNVKPNKCDFCEKRFARPSDLRTHMRLHTGEKPYKCKYCELSFSQSCIRMKHMRIHLGDNVHRCELCPLAFPAPSELREHLTKHKNEDPETRERNMNALKEAEAKLLLELKLAEESQHQLEMEATV